MSEVNMLQETERFPQAPAAGKINKTFYLRVGVGYSLDPYARISSWHETKGLLQEEINQLGLIYFVFLSRFFDILSSFVCCLCIVITNTLYGLLI